MPEGDTLWRTAARLRPALIGRGVVAVETPRAVGSVPRPGEQVLDVRAVGKHLLIDFSGGSTLRTHLRMTGSWHLYRPGERWRKPRHRLVARVAVPEWEAVCFSAPIVEWTTTAALTRRGGALGHLGPDLCRPDSASPEALADCVRRMAAVESDTPIGDVLLDQRVACGVGNVYRSEVCWAERIHPWTPLADVSERERVRLVDRAGHLLRANLGPGPRTTVPGGLAVYGRRGRPCRRCGTAVASEVGGTLARVAYWCSRCQPPPDRG